MSDEIERLLVRVEANATQFEKEMRKLNRTIHGTQAQNRKAMAAIQQDIDRATGGIRRSVMMATTALTALGVSFGASQLINDFREAEESVKRLEAVLKVTGNAAGLSAAQITSWARDLEEATGRSATEIQNAAAQLATYTSIGRAEFTRAIEAANDMAAIYGGDLKSNLDALARALDNPIEGFANLRKRGFALTQAEEKRAEAHVKAGNAAAAMGVVLDNIEGQTKGAAAAINTGITKALNDLQRQAGDTFKALADQGGTDAAIAALTLATRSVEFLGDNMDVLLDAAQALAVFMATRYAVSMGLAGAATLAKAAAALKAKGAVDALSAAMARNPAGLVAVAVAGLVAGTFMLAKATSHAEIAARAQLKVYDQVQPATTELEKLVRKLAAANDEETASIRRKIAELIREEEIKARKARTDYEAARRTERRQIDVREQVTANPVFAYGGMPAGGLQFNSAGGNVNRQGEHLESVRLRQLREEADAYDKAVGELKGIVAEYDEIQQNTTKIEHDAKGDKNAAKKAEARRRAIEDMAAEVDLQEAQLRNDLDRVKALEREAAVRQRTRALIDAEIVTSKEAAKAEAERVQARLDDALIQQEQRLVGEAQKALGIERARLEENHELVRALEREAELQERIEAYNANIRDLNEATRLANLDMVELDKARADAAARRLKDAHEEHRLQVATLSGNDRLAKQLRDQAEIRERAERYRTDGRLSLEDAQRRATDEVGRERAAATYGEQKELFASAFSDGIRAALSGDLQGFLSNQFGNFADTMFKKAGEQIYDAVFGGVDAIADGAAQGASMAATVTPAITGAGAVAATTMGSAITAAGAAAGAAIASAIMTANAASAPFKFGFSEGGYTGPGGKHQPAGVVHKGEVVWSQKDVAKHGGPAAVEALRKGLKGYSGGGLVGSIVPRASASLSRGAGAGRALVVEQHLHNDFKGAVVTEDLLRAMDEKAEMAKLGAVAQVASSASEQQRKARYQTRR